METPDGFDDWSEECKEAFRRLKREYDDRIAAERELAEASRDATAKEAALRELREAQIRDEAERADVQEWLDDYFAEKRALKERLRQELQREFDTWQAAAPRTSAEIRDKRRELTRRRDEQLESFDEERNARRQRKQELENLIAQRRARIDAAEADREAAHDRVEALEARLDGMRSVAQMLEDYFALIRRCGPQDPKPGDPSVPITPRYAMRAPPRLVRPRGVPAYVGFLQLTHAAPEQPNARRPIEMPFVGSFSDVIYPDDADRDEQRPAPRRKDPVAFGRVWHQGCVELLWLEGTEPYMARDASISNPITRSVELAAGHVNDVWKHCCVRFQFFLKIVRMQQLGALADAADGITIVDGRRTCASKDAMNRRYGQIIRGLQEHADCVGFLVVDEVTQGAGFATLGGKVGVVTIRDGMTDRPGVTTAHELGHALGKIEHVEGTGPSRIEHAHGDLMWGEGCAGYPDREQREYEKLLESDCQKMRAATTATTDACNEGGSEPM